MLNSLTVKPTIPLIIEFARTLTTKCVLWNAKYIQLWNKTKFHYVQIFCGICYKSGFCIKITNQTVHLATMNL
jgi:hypothetical protein